MARCCDSIEVPSACEGICEKLINSCCIINADNLPCLFPEVVKTGSGTADLFVITVNNSTSLEVGMAVTGDGVGTGAVITKIQGVSITVSVANTATFTNESLSFTKINVPQCDVNVAIDAALCATQQVGIVFYDFGTGDFALSSTTWNVGPSSYSTKLLYTIPTAGYYRINLEYIVNLDANTIGRIGIGINGSNPATNDWHYADIYNPVNGVGSGKFSQTNTFYIQLAAGDAIRVMYKIVVGTQVEFDPIKMIIEKLPYNP